MNIDIDIKFLKTVLRRLIECDTQSFNKDDFEIIKLLKEICEGIGMIVETIPTKNNPNKINFIAYWTKQPHKIIFSSHFDTVPVGDLKEWKYPPLKATEEIELKTGNVYVYGRGSADMKSGLASQLCILKYLQDMQMKIRDSILLIVSSEEEDGTLGAKDLVKQCPELFTSVELIIVDEPTNLDIGISEKGELRLKVECHGISAHASSPSLGLNAIEGIYSLIQWIKKDLPLSPDDTNQTTFNIGTIKGGNAPNVVADYCVTEIDIRTSSYISVEDIMNNIKTIIASIESTTRFKFVLYEESKELPVTTDINNKYVKLLTKCIYKEMPKSSIKRMAYATDAAAFAHTQNKPQVIIFGPGNEAVIHKPNEYVIFQFVEIATKALVSFLSEINEE
ncbi:peptidase dimerization domain containing protein [Entamoeba histolytica HM-1:IMSS-B]|uniref:Peptidase M20 dimerisation domain-containing protein n=6 Tax=Entamoeba histolytica TaxID=5759 RepID=C4M5U7_ENTH1|nr:hypothetical protein EHI_082250 [Entamoeba histolytica HM-1:IMSS]EMD49379.1 acetylornithine deacetylase, putative [Entamoeba histolytica KU27]EMH74243.1 peptidase dimerization domain containing protein [Entamoeba histolytica HM-1:IMSS-B]EMS17594.1 acetylornithine deacetylase [Entamoeba histolytica HM-3:IMSS]ENY61079.1 acetylornithine deacetylase, putative [Entamoeba histolytica HM-1:IMSS-A]GAT96815.1 hypothetical protein CL6EHI_082250 [Entamoeba histolytica]|eukprot:XP_651923.2 hypothetical protein EHI_082250 [Entamoeba histolytica HM-1:IMSS]